MSIKIATQNIWGRMPLWHPRKRAIARALRGTDVAVLQEVQARGTARSQAHDLADEMGLAHAVFASAGRTLWWREGVGIISRWPILHSRWEKLPQRRWDIIDQVAPRAVLRVVIATPVGTLEVYALHLSLSKKARTRAARDIASFVHRQRQLIPADFSVLAGDFNASSNESCLREIQDQCGVADIDADGTGTFPAAWPMRRLDYLLLSPTLHVSHVQCSTSFGSDHCALLARLNCHPQKY